MWPGWECWNYLQQQRRRAERVTCSQQQQREECLLEVPGVTGAFAFFFFYLRHQRTDPKKKQKKTMTVAVVAVRPTVRRIRTVPDGTEGEKYANCETTITTTQHGRIGVGNNSCADA